MCRRCGEPDRRPGSKDRARLSRRLLELFGNGVVARCVHCDGLVGLAVGYLAVPAARVRIPIARMERDRIIPKGPYSLWNLQPSCGPCNRARTYDEVEVPDGCDYGPTGAPGEGVT